MNYVLSMIELISPDLEHIFTCWDLKHNAKGENMATIKELYNLIKERQRKGIKIGILEQSIVDAYEDEKTRTIKEVNVAFIKNKKGET